MKGWGARNPCPFASREGLGGGPKPLCPFASREGLGGGGGVAGLNRVYLAAGWLHFCIQVVLVLSTTDHATTQVM